MFCSRPFRTNRSRPTLNVQGVMNRRGALRFAALLWTMAACAQGQQQTAAYQVHTVAHNLETVWSLAFAPDGRLFIAERPGRIRVVQHDTLLTEPWAVIRVHESARNGLETGLMGLALDPQFARTRRVYVCYTQSNGNALTNQIAVLTEKNGKAADLRVLLPDIPAGSYHNGCRLKFGPDGKLYATTGDAAGNRAEGTLAQSLTSLAGKVLRMNPDGSVPNDNPYPRSYTWTYGHRNPQGLAWDAAGRLYATEHGTGEAGNNEVNLIERGKNYGWPDVIGVAHKPPFTDPVFVGEDATAGATFVTGSRYGDLRGSLIVATLSAQRLLRLKLTGAAESVRPEVLIDGSYGRLRDVSEGPDGFLYIATSNRDGRGKPTVDDDRVLRLVPR